LKAKKIIRKKKSVRFNRYLELAFTFLINANVSPKILIRSSSYKKVKVVP